ncbi:MAG: hypothetical protein ABJN98_18380 [Roseibium sp.]
MIKPFPREIGDHVFMKRLITYLAASAHGDLGGMLRMPSVCSTSHASQRILEKRGLS